MSEGAGGGVDNCGVDAFCYYFDDMAETGECVNFCTGTEADPDCVNEDTVCGFGNEGVVAFCRQRCNPLLQNCANPNASCRTVTGGLDFACYVDGAGAAGQLQEPCSVINGCAEGLVCIPDENVSDTVNAGGGGFQCTEYCDITSPSCTHPSHTCEALFDSGEGPMGLGHVGICTLGA